MNRLSFVVIGDIEQTNAVPLGLTYEQSRYENGVLRDRVSMAIEAFSYFESQFLVNNRRIVAVDRDHRIIQAEMGIELMMSKNWINVPEPFPFSRYHKEHELPPVVKEIPMFFKEEDMIFLNGVMGMHYDYVWYAQNVWKVSVDGKIPGLPWVSNSVETLTAKCCKQLSIFNRMYTGDKLGKYTMSSCENLYPTKVIRLMEKYNKPTIKLPNLTPMVSKSIFRGLNRMYDYMGVRKYFHKLIWTLTERDVVLLKVPEQSSSGIRSGFDRKFVDHDGIKHKVTPNGTKGDQIIATKKQFWNYVQEFKRTGNIKFLEIACCICLKFEIFNCTDVKEEERTKMYEKCREFFIPNLMQYLFAYYTMKDCQMIERGKMIKIGMKYFYGGAQLFANQMRYNDPTMVYGDGDFKSLDTSIHRVLLELYETHAAVYVDPKSPDYSLFLFMLQLATENLSVKLVHVFARVWKVMFGVMPSGAFETSHGNSWIVGLIWWTYVEWVMSKFPHRSAQIEAAFQAGRIQFPCYGDDHMPGVGREINDIVNETGFSKFVNDVFGMLIRNLRENIPFFKCS
jgi:hypothetical protein